MSNTLSVFKTRQEKTRQSLRKLTDFIEKGRLFGLEPDAGLLEKLAVALETTDQGALKVALIGGFSEGKTSIASAWLERLDQSMNISQQESSSEVKIYRVGSDIELIDTPGLFGFKQRETESGAIEKYKEITRKYVSEAHLVLYVMNSSNPVKESHKEDLHWLFRELDLLPRTVFVLSRFDEVADVEDDRNYLENLKTKKENVALRLKNMLDLNAAELAALKIVGVAANPFGEGPKYWLEHLDEFRKISRISTLQNATRQVIEENGGATPIVLQAQKSMIQDVLGKQMPVVRRRQENLNRELTQLAHAARHLEGELGPLQQDISRASVELSEFVLNHFTSLIRRVQGTSMATFGDFYQKEIGSDGDVLNAKIEQAFNRQCQTVSASLQRISFDFNHEMNRFEESFGTGFLGRGLTWLGPQKITNTHVLAARNGIVSAGKMLGLDLKNFLKFKPYGAANMAARLNVFMAVAGLALEALDSYQKKQKEQEFRETVAEIVSSLEAQRKGLLEFLKSPEFIQQFFPSYEMLREKIAAIENANAETATRKQHFDAWQREGTVIEAEVLRVEP